MVYRTTDESETTMNATTQRRAARTTATEWVKSRGIEIPDELTAGFARFYARYTVDIPGKVGWADSLDDFFLAWENCMEP